MLKFEECKFYENKLSLGFLNLFNKAIEVALN